MRDWFYEQMAMYSAYHRDGRNQATHHIGVPMIVFSLLVIASTVPITALDDGALTLATIMISVLLLTYIVAVPLVGVIAVLIYMTLLFFADQIATQGGNLPLIVFLGCFIGGWIIQFVGHAFEGRKPALFDNLLQIFMAPAFLIAELLFALKLETGLKSEIEVRIDKYLPEDKGTPSAAE
jgi:uncharacterized membrane protein YGL010W